VVNCILDEESACHTAAVGWSPHHAFSNIAGKHLDHPDVLPVLAHIGRRGVPVHLHPAVPVTRVGLDTASLTLSLGLPFDSSLSVVRLSHTGIFDEVPDLHVIVAHAGGVLPYLQGRLAAYSTPSPVVPDAPRLARPVEHYLCNLYVDSVCYDAEALACCYLVLGAEHMLVGTDHPFGAYTLAANLVDALPCTTEERELIEHGNAERLLKLA
jgi:aminocarboxymuconate-semialdehyde decarboxylase